MPDLAFGFTGTQRGWTAAQAQSAQEALAMFHSAGYEWMHNGDCIGADEQAGEFWQNVMRRKIHLHPPTVLAKRAWLPPDKVEFPLPYLERNKAIVDMSSILLATPGEMTEQLRSGTWSTVRYARKSVKCVVLVYPDGSQTGAEWIGKERK
jgi:hypothetical protein